MSRDTPAYLASGLTKECATRIYSAAGPNVVMSPQKCPAILCCLLPCLNSTPKMKIYFSNRPESATVIRSDNRFMIDAASLVVGDVIQLYGDDIVPADVRVLVCKDLIVDSSCLFGSPGSALSEADRYVYNCSADAASTGIPYLDAPNMAFSGSRVISGSGTAVVVATGENCLWSRMISSNRWPL